MKKIKINDVEYELEIPEPTGYGIKGLIYKDNEVVAEMLITGSEKKDKSTEEIEQLIISKAKKILK